MRALTFPRVWLWRILRLLRQRRLLFGLTAHEAGDAGLEALELLRPRHSTDALLPPRPLRLGRQRVLLLYPLPYLDVFLQDGIR